MSEGHGERVDRFRVLYDVAYPRVMAYSLRRARTHEDALDVVSETFAVAWRRFDDIPEDERRIPWMYGVARRVLANHYRATSRKDRLAARMESERPAAPPEFDAIHEALDALRPDDREILTLSAWDDLDNSEIAVVLSITASAVAVRLHRARERLSRELGRLGLSGAKSMKSDERSRTPHGVYGNKPGPGEAERS